ncbi:MAG: ATP-dependent Clp protease proteolytic subunit [Candidatus Sulfotelmatobacter sp.]
MKISALCGLCLIALLMLQPNTQVSANPPAEEPKLWCGANPGAECSFILWDGHGSRGFVVGARQLLPIGTITMGVGTQMMIHRAMGGAMGYADDMRELADILDSVSSSAADIYVARTGLEKDKVMLLMTAETWMSASDAVDSGFATSLSGSRVENLAGWFDLSMFKNTPVSLLQEEMNEYTEDPLINIYRKKLALLRKG